MLFGKSISAWLVGFLVLIGLLPGGKSKSLDKVRFAIWIVITASASFGWIYINKTRIEPLLNPSIRNLILLTSAVAPQVIQMIASVVAFSTAWQRYPWLIRDDQMPPPDTLWYFALVLLSNFWAVYLLTKYIFELTNVVAKVVFGAAFLIYLEIILVITFIVGICIGQLQRNIRMKNNIKSLLSARIFGENIVKEFRCLKYFLSPVMFVHFLCNTLVVISQAYVCLTLKDLTSAPLWCYSLLTMGYICFVVSSCYEEFKSLTDILRYDIFLLQFHIKNAYVCLQTINIKYLFNIFCNHNLISVHIIGFTGLKGQTKKRC